MDNGVMGLSALSPLVSAADQFIREKNIPPDQVPAYLFSVGSPELAGLTAKFQRLKNATQMMPPQGGPPPAPPTVADDINSQMMQYSGVASLPNPAMDKAQFAGGGIVAFNGENGSLVGGPLRSDEEFRLQFPIDAWMEEQRKRMGLGRGAGTEERIAATQPPRPTAKKSSRRGATDTVAEATPPVKTDESAEDYTAQIEKAQAAAGIGKASEAREAQLAAQLEKDKGTAKSDRWFGLAQAGFKMAQAASRPGATFLGSLGEGGADLTGTIREINKEMRQTERAIEAEKYQMALGREQMKSGNITEGRRMFDAAQARKDNLEARSEQLKLGYAQIASQERIAANRVAAMGGGAGGHGDPNLAKLNAALYEAQESGDPEAIAEATRRREAYVAGGSATVLAGRQRAEERALEMAFNSEAAQRLRSMLAMPNLDPKRKQQLEAQLNQVIAQQVQMWRNYSNPGSQFSLPTNLGLPAEGATSGFKLMGVRPGP